MTVSIADAVPATRLFIVLLAAALVATVRRTPGTRALFSVTLTQELKGVAILAVLFSHIGYFLVDDHRFLFPLSILAGVGVNLFLFLSGYGLVGSTVAQDLSAGQFWRRRLPKLFVPFWIALAAFLLLDHFALHIDYGASYVFRSMLGYFPSADLFRDLNSPLWYFTLILAYYLVFPLVFFRRAPVVSAAILYAAGFLLVSAAPDALAGVLGLWEVHIAAFPLGVLTGGMVFAPGAVQRAVTHRLRSWAARIGHALLPPDRAARLRALGFSRRHLAAVRRFNYAALAALLLAVFGYTAYHSGVGGEPSVEQGISLVTAALVIALFLLRNFEFGLLTLFGRYSYEIYLLHWPILVRFDLFYRWLPAVPATVLYLLLFLALGWALKHVSRRMLRVIGG